jgi:hypothetical protein
MVSLRPMAGATGAPRSFGSNEDLRACPISSDPVASTVRSSGWDKSARVGTSRDEFAKGWDGRIGVVGQQRGPYSPAARR